MAELKKETEYKISTLFCQQCQCYRYFYCHKDGGNWFCQMCGWVQPLISISYGKGKSSEK